MKRESRSGYRPDIDGLRAVAITLVVVYHAFPSALTGGFVGVDVFFVISGFLITSLLLGRLEQDKFSLANFYSRRIRRLCPALILVLAFCLIFGRFALLPGEIRRLGAHIAAGAVFVENFVLWREAGYFDASSVTKPLLHLWSLGVEEQFYLIFPVIFCYTYRRHRSVTALVVALLVLSLAGELTLTHVDPVGAFYLPFTRFWELMSGALLACRGGLRPAGVPSAGPITGRWLPSLCSVAGLGLIVLSAVSFTTVMPYPGWRAMLPVAGTVAVIGAGENAPPNRVLLAQRAVVFIGLISYPLYLWHWSLLSFARIMEFGVLSRQLTAGVVAVSVVLAAITWRYVEHPLRSGFNPAYAVPFLAVLTVFVGFEGYESHLRLGINSPRYQRFVRSARLQQGFDSAGGWLGDRVDASCMARFPGFPQYGSKDPERGNYFCRLSNNRPPTILLMADSHSAALWFGLAKNLPRESVANVAMGGCIPYTDRSRAEPNTCHSLDAIIESASKDPAIKALMLTNYSRYYEVGGDYWIDPHAVSFSTGTSTTYKDVMRNSISKTIAPFLRNHKQVFYLLDWPDLPFEPESCVGLRPLRLTAKVRTPCAVPRAEFENDNHARRQIIKDILGSYPQVHVIDLAQPLCDDRWCWAMKGGVPLYFDRSHLSLDGSRYVAEAIAPVILQDLASRDPASP